MTVKLPPGVVLGKSTTGVIADSTWGEDDETEHGPEEFQTVSGQWEGGDLNDANGE